MARDKANENEIDPKVIAGIHVLIDFKKGLLTYKKARQQFKALTGLNHDIAEKFIRGIVKINNKNNVIPFPERRKK
tara:strand:+ start:143 stop:370 length:228 start_codon:yes stop_codon:yes gene_type:complete